MSYVADSNILLRIIQYNHPMHSITVVTPAEITA